MSTTWQGTELWHIRTAEPATWNGHHWRAVLANHPDLRTDVQLPKYVKRTISLVDTRICLATRHRCHWTFQTESRAVWCSWNFWFQTRILWARQTVNIWKSGSHDQEWTHIDSIYDTYRNTTAGPRSLSRDSKALQDFEQRCQVWTLIFFAWCRWRAYSPVSLADTAQSTGILSIPSDGFNSAWHSSSRE